MGGKSLKRMGQEAYWQAKEARSGVLQAEREMAARAARPKKISLGDLENYFLKKLQEMDPIDLLAIGGLAIIIQPMVIAAKEFTDYVTKNPGMIPLLLVNPIAGVIIKELDAQGMPKPSTGEILLSWIVAFVIAAIVVKYLPKMMSGASKIGDFINVSGLLSGLLVI